MREIISFISLYYKIKVENPFFKLSPHLTKKKTQKAKPMKIRKNKITNISEINEKTIQEKIRPKYFPIK